MISDGGSVRILHSAVPGRLRLSVAGLKHDPARARQIEGRAADWAGVQRVSASPATGNLLLEFDPALLTVEQLAGRMRASFDGAGVRRVTGVGSGAASEPAHRSQRMRDGAQGALASRVRMDSGAGGPVAPPRVPQVRALEVAVGAATLITAGALLVAVRSYGHRLAVDQVPLELAEEIHSPALTTFMRGASRLTEPAVVWPVTAAAMALGVGRSVPGELPWVPPVAVAGGGALLLTLKALLRRGRPAFFEHLAPARGYSLPSGHAFMAAVLYGLLADHGLRWLRARRPDDRRAAALLLTAAVAAILLVGASRVYLGVHYPTDVIAGYALGLLWLFFLLGLHDRLAAGGGGDRSTTELTMPLRGTWDE